MYIRMVVLRLVRVAFLIVGMWMLAAVFFGWQHQLLVSARDVPDDLTERLAATAAIMMCWAVVTPIVIYVADLFPLRKPRRGRNAAIMAGVILFVAALQASLGGWLPFVLEGLSVRPVYFRESVLSIFHSYALIAALLVGIANFMRLEREDLVRRRVEPLLQAELAEARLRQLRVELQPHFLFNTLNGVAALLHRDPAAAQQMLVRLLDLLRTSLASESSRETSLAQELEFIARYVELQKMRFGPRLTVDIRVADPWLERAAVPPLLLQPLVENSIVHGVADRRGTGRVIIEAEAAGTWLCLRVRDNGGGIEPQKAGGRESVGIPNARARLEALYGEDQSLWYHRCGDELVAEVRIPLRIIERAA